LGNIEHGTSAQTDNIVKLWSVKDAKGMTQRRIVRRHRIIDQLEYGLQLIAHGF
jgi:hypothetical protein